MRCRLSVRIAPLLASERWSDVAEKRAELVAASNAGRSEDVVRLGAETPSLLTCSDADVLWRVAEAFVKTKRVQRAKDAYGYMLANCSDGPVRVDNVQKALLDALQHGGAYHDDSQIISLHIDKREVVAGGRTLVTIEKC